MPARKRKAPRCRWCGVAAVPTVLPGRWRPVCCCYAVDGPRCGHRGPGAPTKYGSETRMVSLRLPVAWLADVDAAAGRAGLSRTEYLVRLHQRRG